MMFSSHHDAPVAFPDSMRVLDATVNRRSRSNDIIGPAHRVDVITGLKAMTIWPAFQHFEESRKGSLEVGKLADLVILSEDPTAIDPETLDTIVVLETIKEGRTIYRAASAGAITGYRPRVDGSDPYASFLKEFSTSPAAHTASVELGGIDRRILAHDPQGHDCNVVRTLGDLLAQGLTKAVDEGPHTDRDSRQVQ